MRGTGWYAPLDPECPEVIEFSETLDDPITEYYGIGDELMDDFERRHGSVCTRCQEYGAANIEARIP